MILVSLEEKKKKERLGAIYQDAKSDCLQLEELQPHFVFLFKILYFPDFLHPSCMCFINPKEMIKVLGVPQTPAEPTSVFFFIGIRWAGSQVCLLSCSMWE